MYILMLRTHRASEDAFVVRCFQHGHLYDVSEAMARSMLHSGHAIQVYNYTPIEDKPMPDINYNRLLLRVSAPDAEPLSLSETKHYLRIDHEDDDDLINSLIVSARMQAEHWLRRSLITQTWKLGYDDYLPKKVSLPMGPVQAVTSVSVIDKSASSTAISSEIYYMNSAKTELHFDVSVSGFHIEITYNAGYGNTAADMPQPVRQGMLSHIASLYEYRGEQQGGIPEQACGLYAPYREVLL